MIDTSLKHKTTSHSAGTTQTSTKTELLQTYSFYVTDNKQFQIGRLQHENAMPLRFFGSKL